MSDIAKVAKPGTEGGKVYSGSGLATTVKPNSTNDARPAPSGKEEAKELVPGSATDPV
jgi:hypothetical protein